MPSVIVVLQWLVFTIFSTMSGISSEETSGYQCPRWNITYDLVAPLVTPDDLDPDSVCLRFVNSTIQNGITADEMRSVCQKDRERFPHFRMIESVRAMNVWLLKKIADDDNIQFWIDLKQTNGSGWKWGYDDSNLDHAMAKFWSKADDQMRINETKCAYALLRRRDPENGQMWHSERCEYRLPTSYYICATPPILNIKEPACPSAPCPTTGATSIGNTGNHIIANAAFIIAAGLISLNAATSD